MAGRDIKQIDDIAGEFGMSEQQRGDFGDFIEEEKRSGNRGTVNKRGDFTYQELQEKAREFLNVNDTR